MDKFNAKIGEANLDVISHEIQKGQTKGSAFWGPDFENLDYDTVLSAFGKDKILSEIILPELRRLANVISKEAACEVAKVEDYKDAVISGSEQEEAFKTRWTEMFGSLSPRGLTQKALKDRIRELITSLTSLRPVLTKEGTPDFTNPETQKFWKLSMKLQDAQQSLEAKKSKDEAEKDDSAEVPVGHAQPALA